MYYYFVDYITEIFISVVCLIVLVVLILYCSNILKIEKRVRWTTEKIVGDNLELIFPEHKFVKVRPNWLRNPRTNKNLELDYYCNKLNVAIEYNGEQHYKYNEFFHNRDPIKFIKQRQRDSFKEKQCKKHGVRLITIPYTVKKSDIHNFLIEHFIKYGIISKSKSSFKNNI